LFPLFSKIVSQLKQYRQLLCIIISFTLHHHIYFDSHRRYYRLVEIIDMILKKSLCESLLLLRMNNILWCEVPQSRTSLAWWIRPRMYSKTVTGYIPYCGASLYHLYLVQESIQESDMTHATSLHRLQHTDIVSHGIHE
jgi:hypothetical protein